MASTVCDYTSVDYEYVTGLRCRQPHQESLC